MSRLNINSAQVSDYSSLDEFQISSQLTDGIGYGKETEWTNTKWSQYWGYFNQIPELKSAILMKAIWVCGKGYETDSLTKVTLDQIRGWGKDTFDDILFNMEVVKRIGGDSFAEIIRADNNQNTIINLKPLDPSSIKIIVGEKGQIIRYEQINKLGNNQTIRKFKPEDILHFSHNRLADQIHGISDIESLEPTLLAEGQSFEDMKKVIHFQAKPFIVFKLKTDDTTKIQEFAEKIRSARNLGEDMFVPDDENLLSYDVVQVNPSSIIMEWRNDLKNRFYRSLGLPQIVFGSSGTTESGGKIEYLAHEQIFEKDQRYVEAQVWNQLGLKINLIPPVSLLENLQTDQAKDGANVQLGIQPSDLTAGSGR